MNTPDAVHCAAFLFATMIPAGLVHTAWLRSAWSRPLAIPVDCRVTLRGRRLFGPNKMFRGFVALPLAAGVSFFVASRLTGGPWPLSHRGYVLLGIAAGLGFMLGELPNSFIKRQLDIEPGRAPEKSAAAKWMCLLVDRADSILGMLITIQLLAPVPALTWAIMIGAGAGIHALFSVAMFRLGIKARAL
jgi:CDP-2,3-bis-(O-geranylgeranyl)-sn-glycerol synthase